MILVTGGSRSGKSEYAEQLTMREGDKYLYLATARITDAEMARRVEKHQARRSSAWDTHEGYQKLDAVLTEVAENKEIQYGGILLDSISTMLTNMIFDYIGEVDWETFDFADVDWKACEAALIPEFERLGQTAQTLGLPLVIVTDEIGLGVIPDTYLGRAFRDMQGLINQKLAAMADEVYFVVSGIPMKIKGDK